MKEKQRTSKEWIQVIIMMLVPILSAVLFCLFYGKNIFEVYLPATVWEIPNSAWSDELYYYKQVEAVIHHGIPQGFFGYNESTAKYLSFATWNPVVLIPYVLWGMVFGWNLASPFLCNLILCMGMMALFVILTKPNKKQCTMLAMMYLASFFTTRYMFSCMIEVICIFFLVLYISLCINYSQKEKGWKLVLLYFLVCYMTLIRPYLLIFLLLPAYYAFKKYGWKSIFFSVFTFAGISFLYFYMSENFCADYFTNLFDQVWFKDYEISQIGLFIKDTLLLLYKNAKEFIKLCLADLSGTTQASGVIGQFCVVMALLFYTVLKWKQKKEQRNAYFFGYFLGCFGIILVSFFLLYHMYAGSRHLIVFVTAGLFLLCYKAEKYVLKTIIILISFCFFFFQVPMDGEMKKMSFKTPEIEKEYQEWKSLWDEKWMEETSEIENQIKEMPDTPNWDHVVLWVYSDYNETKETPSYLITKWQLLYALPSDFGISCCQPDYIVNEFNNLKAKYLTVVPNGPIDQLCKTKGKTEVGRTENLVMYALR